MSQLSTLTPQIIWRHFEQICAIPHPSKHEKQLIEYVLNFAKEHNLDAQQDAVGNIMIKKPATSGMEDRQTVVLQAHLDMVAQKNEETQHDFLVDPIKPYIDGEWVKAQGTTLGADNGIGMAACLAVLASNDLSHGALEVLLTVDEETGMTGAFGLSPDLLQGTILLNTDTEQEGEVYMGCAGGVNVALTQTFDRATLSGDFLVKTLQIKGLKGGHSGCDIDTGRANATKLLARFLAQHADALELHLLTLRGGTVRNAIAREAFATFALPRAQQNLLAEQVEQFARTLKSELELVEENLLVKLVDETASAPLQAIENKAQQRIIAMLNACPNGVHRMSDSTPRIVETSSNIGIVACENNQLTTLALIRSQSDSGRHYVESMFHSLAKLSGAQVEVSGAYPGWKPDPSSKIMKIFQQTYQDLYGRTPNIMVIHAGLECGLFKKPYPNMDMLSFGPTIKFPHSPDEKVNIHSVELFWQQMCAILTQIPKKEA